MAPNPFPRHLHSRSVTIGPESLSRRPDHALRIGYCLGIWPEVEYQTALMLALLLKAETPGVVAVYATLRRWTSRFEALEAAAKFRLNEHELNIFSGLLKYLGSVERERARLAHSLFAFCDDLPDAILVVSQEDNAAFAISQIIKGNHKNTDFSPQEMVALTKKLLYYKLGDLDRILDQVHNALGAAHLFNRYLTPRLEETSPDEHFSFQETALAELARLAPIAEYLRHQRDDVPQRKSLVRRGPRKTRD